MRLLGQETPAIIWQIMVGTCRRYSRLALLDERGFRGSAKAGISVFDDDFGLHAQQVAPSACSTNVT